MEKKPYSDSRWRDNPQLITSQCSFCLHWHGFGKCDKLGIVSQDILDKSFLGSKNYDPEYCKYKEIKV